MMIKVNMFTYVYSLQVEVICFLISICLYIGSPVFFTSNKNPVLKSLSKTVPLVVVSRPHPYCAYLWECIEKPNMKFESSPVIYVKKPSIYKCSVRNGGRVVDTVHFDVSYDLPYGPLSCLWVSHFKNFNVFFLQMLIKVLIHLLRLALHLQFILKLVQLHQLVSILSCSCLEQDITVFLEFGNII